LIFEDATHIIKIDVKIFPTLIYYRRRTRGCCLCLPLLLLLPLLLALGTGMC